MNDSEGESQADVSEGDRDWEGNEFVKLLE
jgi:hypothetical protein